MSAEHPAERKFITDRMLGPLTRYLRFMGYDTTSANGIPRGNKKEDSELLRIAQEENRHLLTKDGELARRGGATALLITSDDVMVQVQQLIDLQLMKRRLTMSRCSLCNTPLREATTCEIERTGYAPGDWRNLTFFWCSCCRKLYWNGSHGKRLEERIEHELKDGG